MGLPVTVSLHVVRKDAPVRTLGCLVEFNATVEQQETLATIV